MLVSGRTSESEEYAEWKDLLTVLLAAIAKRLTSPVDYCSFRGVCTSWRSAAAFDNFDMGFPRVPRLLYFVEEKEETPVLGDAVAEKREETPILGDAVAENIEETPVLGDAVAEKIEETPILGDAVAEKIEETPVLGDAVAEKRKETPILDDAVAEKIEETPVQGDALAEKRQERIAGKNVKKIVSKLWDLETNTCQITCISSSANAIKYLSCSGWILCISDEEERYSSLQHLMLPINIKLPGMYVSKMVLSGSPLELGADLVVMVIWGMDDELAFCRPGDESWTVIDYWGDDYRNFYDIIYHDNKLYALDYGLTVWECDVHGSNPTKSVEKVFAFPYRDRFNIAAGVEQRFLVESNGKFLIVVKCRSGDESHHFRIYEIELRDGSYNKIGDLEGKCVILGLNSSVCVASRGELKPNCIYLSKVQFSPELLNAEVYSLCDGRFEDLSATLDLCYPPLPVWVVPTI